MNRSSNSRETTRFLTAVAALSLFYLVLQAVYVLRLPLVMDEFQGAHAVHRLSHELPYEDYRPYKTVLGYYIQKPFLSLGAGTWGGLMAVKLAMAALNAIALGFAAIRLRKHFKMRAVLAGFGMTVVMTTLLERGADLRVDMLTSIAGLLGLLFLLERRYATAGAFVALSFCISQKGLYYVLASQAALWALWIVWGDRRREGFRAILRFSLASAAGLAAYLALWGSLTSFRAVLDATFLSHGAIVLGDLYDIQLRYWGQTLQRNPLFYALPLIGLALLDRCRRERDPAWLLVPYGTTLIVLCVWHKQPWPYFFVLLIPTAFVLGTAAIDRLLETGATAKGSTRLIGIVVFIAFGILWPLLRVPVNLRRDNGIQERTIAIAESALDEGDTYLAGVDILYNRSQAHKRLQWLDRPAALSLRKAQPEEIDAIVRQLEQEPPRVFIDSYRTQQLPDPLRRYLRENYCHAGANAYARCIRLTPETQKIDVAFAGNYRLETLRYEELLIDGALVRSGESTSVSGGAHLVRGVTGRLKLDLPQPPDTEGGDAVPEPFFPNVYDY